MRSRGELLSDFAGLTRRLEVAREKIDSALRSYSAKEGYLYSSRLKTVASYFEKLETGRFADPALDDVLAASLIVPTLRDIEPCVESLPAIVEVLEKRDFSTRKKEPDVFRFDDTILVCRLASAGHVADELRFELQVRTLAQHAWSTVTHRPAYKAGVPHWSRLRLAAQFRAVTEQADLVFAEFEQLVDHVPESVSDIVSELVFIAQRIEGWCDAGTVPEEYWPDSIRRTAESVRRFCKEIRVPVEDVCNEVESYLEDHQFPVGLSVFQTFVGVALPRRAGQISWKNLKRHGYRIFLMADTVRVFPGLSKVPSSCTVQ